MSIGIYKIENLINGSIYIGQSIDIEKRFCDTSIIRCCQGILQKAGGYKWKYLNDLMA